MGFKEIRVVERKAFGLDDLTRYPLFTAEFLDLLRRLMPPSRHADLVDSIVITALKPLEIEPPERDRQ